MILISGRDVTAPDSQNKEISDAEGDSSCGKETIIDSVAPADESRSSEIKNTADADDVDDGEKDAVITSPKAGSDTEQLDSDADSLAADGGTSKAAEAKGGNSDAAEDTESDTEEREAAVRTTVIRDSEVGEEVSAEGNSVSKATHKTGGISSEEVNADDVSEKSESEGNKEKDIAEEKLLRSVSKEDAEEDEMVEEEEEETEAGIEECEAASSPTSKADQSCHDDRAGSIGAEGDARNQDKKPSSPKHTAKLSDEMGEDDGVHEIRKGSSSTAAGEKDNESSKAELDRDSKEGISNNSIDDSRDVQSSSHDVSGENEATDNEVESGNRSRIQVAVDGVEKVVDGKADRRQSLDKIEDSNSQDESLVKSLSDENIKAEDISGHTTADADDSVDPDSKVDKSISRNHQKLPSDEAASSTEKDAGVSSKLLDKRDSAASGAGDVEDEKSDGEQAKDEEMRGVTEGAVDGHGSDAEADTSGGAGGDGENGEMGSTAGAGDSTTMASAGSGRPAPRVGHRYAENWPVTFLNFFHPYCIHRPILIA